MCKTDKMASHTQNSYEMDELLMYRPTFRDYTGPTFLLLFLVKYYTRVVFIFTAF